MKHTIEGNKLIVEFDPDSTKLSKSGKTYLLASLGGFVDVDGIGVSYNIVKKVQ
jgi:hypothetical protein